MPTINMLPMMLFWTIAARSGNVEFEWSYQALNTYYIFLIIAISMLTSHIEEDIGDFDIKGGDLSKYLIKPYPYHWLKFFEETPYRVLQGSYGIILFFVLFFFFGDFIALNLQSVSVLLGISAAVLAYLISFNLSLVIGYSSFWLTENRLISELFFIVKIIFAGQIVPLIMLPGILKTIAYFLPFASMIYFPIVIFLGHVNLQESLRLIAIQLAWLLILMIISKLMWKNGIKKFSAVGQ
jgi:ABC-2 type transport system permease protein